MPKNLDIKKEIAEWPSKQEAWNKIEADIRADPGFQRYSTEEQEAFLMMARMKWEFFLKGPRY